MQTESSLKHFSRDCQYNHEGASQHKDQSISKTFLVNCGVSKTLEGVL